MIITEEQKKQCIRLYKSKRFSIKEILTKTGIGSEQTVYRILDEADIPRQRRNSVHKSSISFDAETWNIIEQYHPRKLSQFVCEAIKKVYTNKM